MKKAAWVLPINIQAGSGGIRTVLQNINYLACKGYVCDIYVQPSDADYSAGQLTEEFEKLYGKVYGKFIPGCNISSDYDIIFNIAWSMAAIVRDLQTPAKKVYFVQEYDPFYYSMSDLYLYAKASYGFGLNAITIGKWLSNKLNDSFGVCSQYFNFCADDKEYKPIVSEKENAICFIYQPQKPNRCYRIGTEALKFVKQLRPNVKIYLFGSNDKCEASFEHEHLGIISIDECNRLYNKCKVGLCLSSTNPSRIPFEMMASGLPTVDLYMENNIYDMPDSAVLLAHYTPESIATALISLLDDPDELKLRSAAGVKFMRGKSLEYGFRQFYAAVENILNDRVPIYIKHKPIYLQKPVKVN